MEKNIQENQFSPHSHSQSNLSLDIKASTPDEDDFHTKEVSNEIDNYQYPAATDFEPEIKQELLGPSSPSHEIYEPSFDINMRATANLKRKSDLSISSQAKSPGSSQKSKPIEKQQPLSIDKVKKTGSEMIIEEEEDNEEDLFDPTTVIRKKKTLKDDFEPGNIEIEHNLSEEDKIIINTDIPERLQLRVSLKNQTNETKELIDEEAKWIFEKFRLQRNSFPNENMHKKIHRALNFIKNQHFEVLYLNFYKKHELYPEVQLSELWEIYELDEEWAHILSLRSCVKANLSILENFMEIPKAITDFLTSCNDKASLNNLQDYAIFHLSKYLDGDTQKISLPDPPKESLSKKPMKRVFAYEALQLKLDQFAAMAGLTCEELAENLSNETKSHKKTLLKKPKYVAMTPEKVAQEYVNKDKSLVADTLNTLTSLCRYMASELFQEPIVRQHLKKVYFENVTLSTEPTLKGNKELDIYHPYYIVKRINRRPPNEFQDDLWLKMLKCERDGLIKIRVILPWEEDLKNNNKDFNDLKDEIYNTLLKLYIASINDASEVEKSLIIQWNIVRGEVLRIFLIELLYPFFEKTLKDELTEISEKYVIGVCGRKLKEILNTAPYLVTHDDEGEGLHKPRIVSVILETNVNNVQTNNSGKISFVCVDPNGLLIDHLTLKFYAMQNIELQIPSIKETYEKDVIEFEKFMKKHLPDLVIVSSNSIEARRIKQMMVNYRDDYLKSKSKPINKGENEESDEIQNIVSEVIDQKHNFGIIFGDNVVPSLFAKTCKAEIEFKGSPLTVKEGVSLARYAQNPLAEILNLWSEKNQENAVFYIPFHPLQNQINLNKLRNEYERIVIESVNTTGLNFNEILKYSHFNSLLQFVCGLGPRKAINLIENLNSKEKNKAGFQGLKSRGQLLSEKLMEKKVFTNCAGFFKIKLEKEYDELDFESSLIEKKPDSLDVTRIHPENYSLAKKIAKDALDEDAGVNPQDLIPKIMRNSFKLRELDLDDYSNHLATYKNLPNMIYVLSFIVEELIFPFRDPRNFPFLYNPKEIFYKLSKESQENFKVNSLVNAKVSRILKSNLLCKLENGLTGSIYYLDIFEKKEGATVENLSQFFEEGQNIRAKIKNIDYEKFRIELTIRPSDLKPNKNQLKDLFPNYWENLSKYFKIKEDEDFPVMPECKKITLKYMPRSLNHEKFKNVSLSGALEHLGDKAIGDFIIRPSNKGENLIITWKFFEMIFVHLDIKETQKSSAWLTGSRYSIGKDQYDSLDEVIEKTVGRCNHIMSSVMEHLKFKKDPLNIIEKALFEEKEKDTKITPYYFGCSELAPQFLVLVYLMSSGEIIKEFIKVKPEGLFFHHSYFTSLKMLIQYFKENFRTEEYHQYLKNAKPPFFDIDDQFSNLEIPKTITDSNNPIELDIGTSNSVMGDNNNNNNNSTGGWANQQPQEQPMRKSYRPSNEEGGPRKRPECTFCNRPGHTEETCFKKNGKPADFVPRGGGGAGGGYGGSRGDRGGYRKPREDRDNDFNKPSEGNSNWNMTRIEPTGGNNNDNGNGGWGDPQPTNQIAAEKPAENNGGDGGNAGGWGESQAEPEKPKPVNSSGGAWGDNREPIEEKPKSGGWGDNAEQEPPKKTGGWGESNDQGQQPKNNNSWGGDGDSKPQGGWGRSNDDGGGDGGGYRGGFGGRGGRGGGRGGGPGGERKRGCFKCGEEGHMAKDCTKEGTDRPPRKSGCFKCGEEGHMAKDCTKEGVERPKTCRICNKEGHMARECPDKTGGGGGGGDNRGPKKCFNCGGEGHMSIECTEPKKPRVPKCFNCEEEGHVSKECTKERRPFCHNCKKVGHKSFECPEPKNPDAEERKPFCHNCKKVGHKNFECPEPKNPDAEERKPYCFNCKQVGHKSFECPEPKNPNTEERKPRFNNNNNGNNNGRSRSRENDRFGNNNGGGGNYRGGGNNNRGGFHNNNGERRFNNNRKNFNDNSGDTGGGAGAWADTGSGGWGGSSNTNPQTNNDNNEGGWSGSGKNEEKKTEENVGGWGAPPKSNESLQKKPEEKKNEDNVGGWSNGENEGEVEKKPEKNTNSGGGETGGW